jgi:hypothetical protein
MANIVRKYRLNGRIASSTVSVSLFSQVYVSSIVSLLSLVIGIGNGNILDRLSAERGGGSTS